MRPTLLALAVFYAWLPSGMCACQLQAALFPPNREAGGDWPTAPNDDDEDGPHECHCTGAKPVCDVTALPCLTNDSTVEWVVLKEVVHFPFETANDHHSVVPPFREPDPSPLYLTLRALLI
jgi:hypothetical protein